MSVTQTPIVAASEVFFSRRRRHTRLGSDWSSDVCSSDLKETKLPVSGRLTAGARANPAIKPGTAIRIFTGAAMPKGADTVFMQEDVTVEGDRVTVPKG